MTELLIPDEVSFTRISSTNSFSPKNFGAIDIPRKNKLTLREYLNEKVPFIKGIEPGTIAYVPKSNIRFVRNSCINSESYTNDLNKEIYLNPNYGFLNTLETWDVLLCKDANIGEACLFYKNDNYSYQYSSGMVKLNIADDKYKYYLLAMIRDSYFQSTLDSLTPRGSTIRHAGNKFLECKIPTLTKDELKQIGIFEIILKNLTLLEVECYKKQQEAIEIIEEELLASDYEHCEPSISSLINSARIDAGFYSEEVEAINYSVSKYPRGASSIESFGFKVRRGPNLAKRDLGRSLKSTSFKQGYNILVYPSDISDFGCITKQVYLGSRSDVWFLHYGDVLFSAEGSVGKAFCVCSEDLKFTTNFHGIILTPIVENKEELDIARSAFLTAYLTFLRKKGVLDKLSVGGQGGSLAVSYWDTFKIPLFQQSKIEAIAVKYYSNTELDPFEDNTTKIPMAGISDLSNFRIKLEALLKKLVNDVKSGQLRPLSEYKEALK